MINSTRINSRPIGRTKETIGEMIARVNKTAALLRCLDDAKYGKPQKPRRFACNGSPNGNAFTLATTGVVWYSFEGELSMQTPYSFRDLMNMVAKMEIREVTHEVR